MANDRRARRARARKIDKAEETRFGRVLFDTPDPTPAKAIPNILREQLNIRAGYRSVSQPGGVA